ncbi:hypothetical protein AMEX_G27623 [Astyanax mexicanus]|uniref:Uncharacterized protein n=1 Tax=Astyanax mexicanus TaxID=7994 RepID=A0A8T2KT56_ASTMX|nr:hypothetical protein AMEX_G27623 [Astyanax mexicanus]
MCKILNLSKMFRDLKSVLDGPSQQTWMNLQSSRCPKKDHHHYSHILITNLRAWCTMRINGSFGFSQRETQMLARAPIL